MKILVPVLIAALVGGCGDEAPRVSRFGVALGASFDIAFFTSSGATLSGATSEDPAVATVVGTGETAVRLEARAEGTARVRLDVSGGADQLVDIVVRPVASAVIGFVTRDLRVIDHALAVSEAPFLLDYVLLADDRQVLGGYGLAAWEVDPAAALAAPDFIKGGGQVRYLAPAEASSLTITPLGGDPITMEVIESADVDDMSVIPAAGVPIEVGRCTPLSLELRRGDDIVTHGTSTLEASSDTQAVCNIRAPANAPCDPPVEPPLIYGNAAGACRASFSFAAAAGGAGLTTELELLVTAPTE